MLWAYPAQALMVSWCKCVATLPLDTIPASKNLQGSLCQSLYLICIHGFFSVDLSGLVPKPCSICSSSWKGGLLCAESPPCVILVIAASPTSPSCADLCSVTLAVPKSPGPSWAPCAETLDHLVALLCTFSSSAVSLGYEDQECM